MSDPVNEAAEPRLDDERAPPAAKGIVGKAAFVVGTAGLLLATAADSIAVLGRHTGFALLGAIEIVQSAIVLIAAASMVCVTLSGGHAAVHILTDRLKARPRVVLAGFAHVLSAATAILLVLGSAILLVDLWNGYERSELLHVPLRWFRLMMIVALAIVATLFVRGVLARGDRRGA